MNKKKIFAGALSLCIILGGFAGCGGKNEKKDGISTIKWYTIGTKQVDQNIVMEKINAELEKNHKLNLDFELVDAGAYSEKMNMSISSGEEFDLCFTSNWTNVFSNVVSKNGFMAIDEFLNSDRKGLYEALPEFTWEDAKIGGKIMAVPNYQSFYRQSSAWIPTKYIEKYNIDISNIKSIYDLEPVLKALKENEPDIYPVMPYEFAGTSFDGASLMDGINKYDIIRDTPFLVVDKDFKVHCTYDLPELEKEYELFREWYTKGYTRSDIVSAVNSKEDDINALKYGVWLGGNSPSAPYDAIQKYGEPITIVPLAEPYISHNIGHATMTAVSATSKQPDEALRLLEIMFTNKDTFNTLLFGIEGEHYEKIDDNTVKLLDEGQKYNLSDNAWAYGNLFNSYYIEGTQKGVYEETDKINREAVTAPIRGFSVDLSPITVEVAKVNSVKSEYEYLALGSEEPTELLKEYREKLRVAGLDTIIVEIQKQLDEFVKLKK